MACETLIEKTEFPLRSIVIKKLLLFALCFIAFAYAGRSQQFIPLWPDDQKPNDKGKVVKDSIYNDRIWAVGTPGIYAFLVPKEENKGAAVLICPGGGYARLSYLYNGFNLAKWYNVQGINAFVLIARLPHQKDLINREIAPLQDAQRSMKIIRARAGEWGINSQKIGVMGSSAGGHTAAMLGTRRDDVSSIKDSLDNFSFRPDFMVLLSPVITMGKYAHKGSRNNLLGKDTASSEMIQKYSNENNVTAATPPTFLIHAFNDKTVPVQNSLLFYNALIAANVNASIHIFPQGQHGINLINNPGSANLWYDLLRKWLVEMGFNDISSKK
jgi:acetyl esterase/lipase